MEAVVRKALSLLVLILVGFASPAIAVPARMDGPQLVPPFLEGRTEVVACINAKSLRRLVVLSEAMDEMAAMRRVNKESKRALCFQGHVRHTVSATQFEGEPMRFPSGSLRVIRMTVTGYYIPITLGGNTQLVLFPTRPRYHYTVAAEQ